MHPYHVVQGARPYPIDWVHAPIFLSSDLRTHIPSFGLHAHNFFEFTYLCPSPLAYALVFLSLGLRTYILLPWVTHPCLLWVTHPYCFVGFLCTPAHLYVPFSLLTNMVRYSYTLGLRNQLNPSSFFHTYYQHWLNVVPYVLFPFMHWLSAFSQAVKPVTLTPRL